MQSHVLITIPMHSQLDQLVAKQQSSLEKAGVPGFRVTSDPMEVRVQMYLLEFILKLAKDQDLSNS